MRNAYKFNSYQLHSSNNVAQPQFFLLEYNNPNKEKPNYIYYRLLFYIDYISLVMSFTFSYVFLNL